LAKPFAAAKSPFRLLLRRSLKAGWVDEGLALP